MWNSDLAVNKFGGVQVIGVRVMVWCMWWSTLWCAGVVGGLEWCEDLVLVLVVVNWWFSGVVVSMVVVVDRVGVMDLFLLM